MQHRTPLDAAIRKATLRLVPFLFLLYIVAYLDRINVSFAALTMNADMGLSQTAYGLGAGIFFLGYFLFEVPSNLILARVGPRLWITRIMLSWGLVTMAMPLAHGPLSFAVLRFALGVAEAGFFPGVILYLTYWFPQARRARTVALFMTATPVAGLVGSPMSGLILGMHGAWGIKGWQWLFLLEGVPAVVMGVIVFLWLPERPCRAGWLAEAEGAALEAVLALENQTIAGTHLSSLRQGLTSPRVWLLGWVYFCAVVAMYGLVMWLPQIIAGADGGADGGAGDGGAMAVSGKVMVAYFFAAMGMVLIGASSDHFAERRWHVAGSLALCMAGMLVLSMNAGVVGILAGASLAAMGIWGVLGPFWGLATAFLTGSAAAAGIALINSLGNLGGFAGPYLMGWVKADSGGFSEGFLFLAGLMALGALPVLLVKAEKS